MSSEHQYVPSETPRKAVILEEALSQAIQRTAEEISHAECLDEEQRSEVYTILDTLRADTLTHRRLVGRWVSDRPGGTSDA